jgi:uncharacterized protein HemY
MSAGSDALALMRRRLARLRKAAEAERAALAPLTASRFDGVERSVPDEDAVNAVRALTLLLGALAIGEDALT